MRITKVASLVLTVVLCLSLCITGHAVGTITGVTVGLDKDALTVSSSAQTVTVTLDLTLSGGDSVAARGANYKLSLPEGWTMESYSFPEAATIKNASATAGMWALMSGSTEISSLVTLVIGIPANTPAGVYNIAVSSVKVSDASNTTLFENGSAEAAVTIKDPVSAAPAYAVGSLAVRSADGTALSAIPAGDFLVTVPVTKTAGEGDCLVFLAAYGASGQFRGLMYVELEDVPEGGTVKVTLPVENSGGGIAGLKAFCVASFADLTPLGEAAAFPAED